MSSIGHVPILTRCECRRGAGRSCEADGHLPKRLHDRGLPHTTSSYLIIHDLRGPTYVGLGPCDKSETSRVLKKLIPCSYLGCAHTMYQKPCNLVAVTCGKKSFFTQLFTTKKALMDFHGFSNAETGARLRGNGYFPWELGGIEGMHM